MSFYSHVDKYGRELSCNTTYAYAGERPSAMIQNRAKERRSDMRAAIAVAMSREGIEPDVIDSIMNYAYELNMKCKAEGTSIYSIMQQETGLLKI